MKRALIFAEESVRVGVLRENLEVDGYEVRVMRSLEDALLALEQESKFDLVVGDVLLTSTEEWSQIIKIANQRQIKTLLVDTISGGSFV